MTTRHSTSWAVLTAGLAFALNGAASPVSAQECLLCQSEYIWSGGSPEEGEFEPMHRFDSQGGGTHECFPSEDLQEFPAQFASGPASPASTAAPGEAAVLSCHNDWRDEFCWDEHWTCEGEGNDLKLIEVEVDELVTRHLGWSGGRAQALDLVEEVSENPSLHYDRVSKVVSLIDCSGTLVRSWDRLPGEITDIMDSMLN